MALVIADSEVACACAVPAVTAQGQMQACLRRAGRGALISDPGDE
jgi:hypothetical protein